MDTVIGEQLNLAEITRREVEMYAGNMQGAKQFAVLDDEHQIYSVVTVPENPTERPAWVGVMAHIVDQHIFIDEDTSIDKPLVDALTARGIPRDKIVLAYKGEKLLAMS